jgi:cardiolipin synthase
MNVALAITLLRFLFAPLLVWLLLTGNYAAALSVFLAGSISDALDGHIARRFNQETPLGALLDPLADKLLIACGIVMLAWLGHFPLWLMITVLLRDVIIMSGALAYRHATGRLEMAPLFISKVNTAIQFTLVLAILATFSGLGWLAAVLPTLTWLTFFTTLASGIQYIREWSCRARRAINNQTL